MKTSEVEIRHRRRDDGEDEGTGSALLEYMLYLRGGYAPAADRREPERRYPRGVREAIKI